MAFENVRFYTLIFVIKEISKKRNLSHQTRSVQEADILLWSHHPVTMSNYIRCLQWCVQWNEWVLLVAHLYTITITFLYWKLQQNMTCSFLTAAAYLKLRECKGKIAIILIKFMQCKIQSYTQFAMHAGLQSTRREAGTMSTVQQPQQLHTCFVW